MAYPIEDKLVIAIASSALFDLKESDLIFKRDGEEKYRKFQEDNIDRPFDRGVAFPFIKRLLGLNASFPEEMPVEFVLMSKNSPETGERVFRSIQHYGLSISRACFTSGKSNFQYLPAFNASLFLSANYDDVRGALLSGMPAGQVLNDKYVEEDDKDNELRIAFDFDGVLASDESEKVFKSSGGDVDKYLKHETRLRNKPLHIGPIGKLLQKISRIQMLEKEKYNQDRNYKRIIKTAIVTARNAPAHQRVTLSLKDWGVEVDETFFLGGITKSRILNVMKPHIFFVL